MFLLFLGSVWSSIVLKGTKFGTILTEYILFKNPYDIVSKIKNADVLYHEATFLKEHSEIANRTGHSTTIEAAKIAKKSKVKRLIIGHYSKRYSDRNELMLECKSIFKNSFLANEGDLIDFNAI